MKLSTLLVYLLLLLGVVILIRDLVVFRGVDIPFVSWFI